MSKEEFLSKKEKIESEFQVFLFPLMLNIIFFAALHFFCNLHLPSPRPLLLPSRTHIRILGTQCHKCPPI